MVQNIRQKNDYKIGLRGYPAQTFPAAAWAVKSSAVGGKPATSSLFVKSFWNCLVESKTCSLNLVDSFASSWITPQVKGKDRQKYSQVYFVFSNLRHAYCT